MVDVWSTTRPTPAEPLPPLPTRCRVVFPDSLELQLGTDDDFVLRATLGSPQFEYANDAARSVDRDHADGDADKADEITSAKQKPNMTFSAKSVRCMSKAPNRPYSYPVLTPTSTGNPDENAVALSTFSTSPVSSGSCVELTLRHANVCWERQFLLSFGRWYSAATPIFENVKAGTSATTIIVRSVDSILNFNTSEDLAATYSEASPQACFCRLAIKDMESSTVMITTTSVSNEKPRKVSIVRSFSSHTRIAMRASCVATCLSRPSPDKSSTDTALSSGTDRSHTTKPDSQLEEVLFGVNGTDVPMDTDSPGAQPAELDVWFHSAGVTAWPHSSKDAFRPPAKAFDSAFNPSVLVVVRDCRSCLLVRKSVILKLWGYIQRSVLHVIFGPPVPTPDPQPSTFGFQLVAGRAAGLEKNNTRSLLLLLPKSSVMHPDKTYDPATTTFVSTDSLDVRFRASKTYVGCEAVEFLRQATAAELSAAKAIINGMYAITEAPIEKMVVHVNTNAGDQFAGDCTEGFRSQGMTTRVHATSTRLLLPRKSYFLVMNTIFDNVVGRALPDNTAPAPPKHRLMSTNLFTLEVQPSLLVNVEGVTQRNPAGKATARGKCVQVLAEDMCMKTVSTWWGWPGGVDNDSSFRFEVVMRRAELFGLPHLKPGRYDDDSPGEIPFIDSVLEPVVTHLDHQAEVSPREEEPAATSQRPQVRFVRDTRSPSYARLMSLGATEEVASDNSMTLELSHCRLFDDCSVLLWVMGWWDLTMRTGKVEAPWDHLAAHKVHPNDNGDMTATWMLRIIASNNELHLLAPQHNDFAVVVAAQTLQYRKRRFVTTWFSPVTITSADMCTAHRSNITVCVHAINSKILNYAICSHSVLTFRLCLQPCTCDLARNSRRLSSGDG